MNDDNEKDGFVMTCENCGVVCCHKDEDDDFNPEKDFCDDWKPNDE